MLCKLMEGAQFIIITNHDALKWISGPLRTSGRRASWHLRLKYLPLMVEHLPHNKNITTDAISQLHTKGRDYTVTLIYLEVPVLSMEDDVVPPTLHDHELAVSQKGKIQSPAKPIIMKEILSLQNDEL